MFDEINLAVKNDTKLPKKELLERLKIISFGALFIVALLSVIVFLVNLRLSTSSIKDQQSRVLQNLSPYNDTIAKIYLLNSRLDDIGVILNKRRSYSDVSQIINLVNAGVRVKSYSQDNSQNFSITVTSSSLGDINDYLNSLLKLRDDGTVRNVVLTTFKSDPAEGYIMSSEVSLR